MYLCFIFTSLPLPNLAKKTNMAKKKKKWIAGAIKKPGALTKAAKAKGMTISEYCAQSNLSSLGKKRCNLWKTLKKFR